MICKDFSHIGPMNPPRGRGGGRRLIPEKVGGVCACVTNSLNTMIQSTANESATGLRRICKKSDQPKKERLVNNDARLILRIKLDNDLIECKLKAVNCNRVYSCIDLVGPRHMLLIFNVVWPWFCCWIVLSVRSLLTARQRHDIVDFCYCPLSRILHVKLANLQQFGFAFHTKSLPSAAYNGLSAD